MPYPNDFNAPHFDATIGSRETEADQIYDAMASHLQDIVNRAFSEFPLDVTNRWLLVNAALDKADDALKPLVGLSGEDESTMGSEIERAIDANCDGDKAALSQNVGSYMFVYRAAMDRAEAA